MVLRYIFIFLPLHCNGMQSSAPRKLLLNWNMSALELLGWWYSGTVISTRTLPRRQFGRLAGWTGQWTDPSSASVFLNSLLSGFWVSAEIAMCNPLSSVAVLAQIPGKCHMISGPAMQRGMCIIVPSNELTISPTGNKGVLSPIQTKTIRVTFILITRDTSKQTICTADAIHT